MTKKLRILHLSTTRSGGAGIFSQEICDFLQSRNYENRLLTFTDFLKKGLLRFRVDNLVILFKLFFRAGQSSEFYARHIRVSQSLWNKGKLVGLVKQYDRVIIHRSTNFLSIDEILLISECVDLCEVIGIDESVLTPYCTYTFGCEQFSVGCHNCPIARDFKVKERIREDFRYIEKALSLWSGDPHKFKFLFANKEELYKYRRSVWARTGIPAEVRLFPYVYKQDKVDLEILKKRKLDLLPDNIFVGVSALKASRRKGFDILNKFLLLLDSDDISKEKKIVLSIVVGDNLSFSGFKNIEVRNLKTMPPKYFERFLSEQHIFLSFSREDSGPYTLNMCYALGIFIGAFDVGISREIEKRSELIKIAKEKNEVEMLKIFKAHLNSDLRGITESYNLDNSLFWK